MSTDVDVDVKESSSVNRRILHKNVTFNSYIHKVLRSLYPNTNITKIVTSQLDVFLKLFATNVSSQASNIAFQSGKNTVSVDDIDTAIKLILPKDLLKNALTAGAKAISRFNDSISDTKRQNKAKRCGLLFPPYLAEKFLRYPKFGGQISFNRLNIAQHSPIYLAAVLEYLTSELMSTTATFCRTGNRKTITIRHLFLATNNDLEMDNLLKRMNIAWLGGGVEEVVHKSLLPDKEKQKVLAAKRRKNRKEIGTSIRKSLPGTKALRDIKKYQRTIGLLQRKEHFNRFVREQSTGIWEDHELVHYSSGVLEYLQLYTEDFITMLCRRSVNVMLHAKRETLEASDLVLTWSFLKPHDSVCYSSLGSENLAEPGLRRLAYRGGVKRISQTCYQVIREIMTCVVSRILYTTFILMKRQRVKTVTFQYLVRGAAVLDINLPLEPSKRPLKKKNASDLVQNEFPIPTEEDGFENEEPVE